jgi:plastocyanin
MRRLLLLVVLGAPLFVVACGGGGSSGPPCPPAAESRSAVDGKVTVCGYDIRFDVKEITAPAGPLEITLINKGRIEHTMKLEITGTDFELKTPGRGDSDTGTITLEPGTYEFVCTVAGHEQAGMKGTLVVS